MNYCGNELLSHALIAQWIEQIRPKDKIEVRLLVRAPE